eukprot:3627146-Prymnesium_polylepis.2
MCRGRAAPVPACRPAAYDESCALPLAPGRLRVSLAGRARSCVMVHCRCRAVKVLALAARRRPGTRTM